jgi:ubiquinone/menaquinone biosynthesis C-methylase UbiE
MTEQSAVKHPIFARFFDRLSQREERLGQAEHRRELLAGLAGRMVDVGAGNGLNFRFYPPAVTEVVAVEPEPYLRDRAGEAARDAPVRVEVIDGVADRLPADDASFDAGIASLVLCTVPDQRAALTELFRVIRPGGELRFYEHVRADGGGLARFQDAAALVWPTLGGGCHPNRDTAAAIEAAGFSIERCRRFPFRPCFFCAPVAPRILGVARRPYEAGGSTSTGRPNAK